MLVFNFSINQFSANSCSEHLTKKKKKILLGNAWHPEQTFAGNVANADADSHIFPWLQVFFIY